MPTYDQLAVTGMAEVLTGWSYYKASGLDFFSPPEYLHPMVANPEHHDPETKTILNGVVLAGGRTMQQDLNDALDTIFYHPNVGPHIRRQLIQPLVTSNPSPAFVSRVAAAFNDNV